MSRVRDILKSTDEDKPMAIDPSRNPPEELPWLESPEPEEATDEPLIPRKWLFIGLAAFLVLLVGITAVVYRTVTQGQTDPGNPVLATVPDDQLPLIEAPKGPIKVRPTEPGGMQVADLDKGFFEGTTGQAPPVDPLLAPPAEEPIARAPAAPAPTPGPVVQAPVPAPAAPPVQQPAARPAPPAAVAQAPKPAAAPAPKPAAPVAAPAPKPVAPVAAPAPISGVVVQLGAFSSRERALAGWKTIQSANGELASLRPDLQDNGKGLFRLRAGPLPSSAAATQLCGALKGRGQACTVVN
jgi:cell division septation protein DedD